MATNGNVLINTLARRLRDTANTAHPRDLLRRILSQSQRALNLHDRIRRKTSVTFTTTPGQVLYNNTAIGSDVSRIERIIALDRSLPEVSWQQLVDNSRNWSRQSGARSHMWARIGGTMWALTPATWDPQVVTVVYITTPADVVDGATPIDFSDEFVPMLLDLSEGIMLLKARLYPQLDGCMGRLAAMLPQKPGAGAPRDKVNI